MTIYRPEDTASNGKIYRWRLQHRKLRVAKKKRERWLHTAGRIWDVRHAGRHDNCTKLAQRPPQYAVRLEGWRRMGPLRFFDSRWDMYSDADVMTTDCAGQVKP